MKTHTAESLRQKNFQSDIYGSYGWIQNASTLVSGNEYTLHITNKATIGGGREFIALPVGTRITYDLKTKYDLH